MTRLAVTVVLGLATTDAVLALTFDAEVVKVIDGDTLAVADATGKRHTVRLAGIDAPEKRQPFWLASRKHLRDLADGRAVTVEYEKLDRYGRMLAKVRVGEADINLAQVKVGLAWHYTAYALDQRPPDRTLYQTAQHEARNARMGLWSDPEPRSPWDFRKGQQITQPAR